ncbi:MAG: hypothetical protein JKY30_14210, partial [Flavobacteriales bacterium]|nr:hypothetical protein [Flavobacteriales bacterium]
MRVNPAAALRGNKEKGKKGDKKATRKSKLLKKRKAGAAKRLEKANTKRKEKDKTKIDVSGNINSRGALGGLGSGYGIHNFASESRPTQIVDYNAISTTLSLGLMLPATPTPTGPSADVFGTYSRQKNVETSNLNTYGYMYSANAGGGD